MSVSAAISEIHKLNQNKNKRKKEKKNSDGYFQFNTFPGHIIYPFLNQRYLLSTYICIQFVRSPVHHKLKVIFEIP